ncbi:MAG TPA: hypothetical protein VI895_12075 [Bdellovibrionota bacterium]|nr:hypothetical protein [Bdellovibrionota bacterium]
MWIRFNCRECKSVLPWIEISDTTPLLGVLLCKRGHTVTYRMAESLAQKGEWEECPSCGSLDAFIQKDVPKKLLLGILIVFLAFAFYLLLLEWILGMGVLFALALVDVVLYLTLPNVLVCYNCGAQVRGFQKTEQLTAFDHHVGERYRQARL